jgi:alpha-tubulin suppressor-like RCC1 family protein
VFGTTGRKVIKLEGKSITGVTGTTARWVSVGDAGAIVAWGSNRYGECNVPAPNTGFVAIAASERHSLGLKADSSIVAWGGNHNGECDVPAPNTGFVAIAAGNAHWDDTDPYSHTDEEYSLGLKADGSIVAWGWNGGGECDVPSPNTGFVAIATHGGCSFGLKSDGTIVAWGHGHWGRCDVPSPNADFVAVAPGLGLKSDGSIVGWGVPSPNAGFVAIAGSGSHYLGLKADGSIVAWGSYFCGECNAPAPNTGFVAIAAGSSGECMLFFTGGYSMGLKADGSIVVWGACPDYCYVPSPNTGFVAIAAGRGYSLGLTGLR